MTREWKPGDVAMRVSKVTGDKHVALRVAQCPGASLGHLHHWHFVDPEIPQTQCGSDYHDLAEYRPLVVIDFEDREQVERLRNLMDAAYFDQNDGALDFPALYTAARGNALQAALQAALREFANPTPPRPEEPQGLGAVVFAICECRSMRRRFVRDDTGSEFPESPWKAECGHHVWADLDIRDADDILSEGVTP